MNTLLLLTATICAPADICSISPDCCELGIQAPAWEFDEPYGNCLYSNQYIDPICEQGARAIYDAAEAAARGQAEADWADVIAGFDQAKIDVFDWYSDCIWHGWSDPDYCPTRADASMCLHRDAAVTALASVEAVFQAAEGTALAAYQANIQGCCNDVPSAEEHGCGFDIPAPSYFLTEKLFPYIPNCANGNPMDLGCMGDIVAAYQAAWDADKQWDKRLSQSISAYQLALGQAIFNHAWENDCAQFEADVEAAHATHEADVAAIEAERSAAFWDLFAEMYQRIQDECCSGEAA